LDHFWPGYNSPLFLILASHLAFSGGGVTTPAPKESRKNRKPKKAIGKWSKNGQKKSKNGRSKGGGPYLIEGGSVNSK
jgi:hypothetical protein